MALSSMRAKEKCFPDPTHLAAYLGHAPARTVLRDVAPPVATFQSMMKGGDRLWRAAMKHPSICAKSRR